MTFRSIRYIGCGEFGKVEQGILTEGGYSVDVALKTLKDKSCEENVVKFLQEAAIMAQFHHPNLIGLYGIAKSDEKVRFS